MTEADLARESILQEAELELKKLPPLLSLPPKHCPFLKHFWCIFLKRCKLSARDWKTLVFEIACPLIMCVLTIALLKTNASEDMPVQSFSDLIFSS